MTKTVVEGYNKEDMGNEQVYAQRMEGNVDDKLIIFDFIRNKEPERNNILDFGCGSGSIFKYLNTMHPSSISVGFDKSDFMLARAKENYPNNIFLSTFEELNAFVVENGSFNYIILNSLLHEIYSYEDGFTSVVEVLKILSRYLTNTGSIIVRDGVLDTTSCSNIYEIESFKLRNVEEARTFLNEYTYLSPFPNHSTIQDGNITGIWYEVREFLNKYTWGFDSLYREAKEIVNFASLEMYENIFTKAGYRIKDMKLVKQEEYFTYLNKIIEVNDSRWNTKIVFSAKKNV